MKSFLCGLGLSGTVGRHLIQDLASWFILSAHRSLTCSVPHPLVRISLRDSEISTLYTVSRECAPLVHHLIVENSGISYSVSIPDTRF